MVTEFNTKTTGKPKSASSKIVLGILLITAAYVGYRFWLKPKLDKKAQDEQN